MEQDYSLVIPGTENVLRPGYKVKLGRFDTTIWTVGFGWYAVNGNRPCCGWYLTTNNFKTVKPLQLSDLNDIYLIEICYVSGDEPHRSIEAIDKEVIDIRKGFDDTDYESAGEAIRTQISKIYEILKNNGLDLS